ncbi:MAG: S9 family peptidase [Gemmatimonadota bacterium]|nr:MAG: S9 family peptidase [Gemmatimonadota bacterium]
MRLTYRITPLITVVALLLPIEAPAQQKQSLDHESYDIWKTIVDTRISNDGRWISYSLNVREGDAELYVQSVNSGIAYTVPRGREAQFTHDGRFLVFKIKPELALVREAQKEKKKPDEQPKDSLGIMDLSDGEVFKVERVKSFELPEEGNEWVAYLLEKQTEKPDSSEEAESPAEEPVEEPEEEGQEEEKKEKKPGQIGTTLVLRDLASGDEQRYESVMAYAFSKNGDRLLFSASNKDGTADGLMVVEIGDLEVIQLMTGEGIYKNAAFDDDGEQVAFISNRDDFQADQPAFNLYHWREGQAEASQMAREGSPGIPEGWWVSEHGDLEFSENGGRLFFGTAPRPDPEPEEETPEWEKVEVDIWNWKDPLLQPMQLVQKQRELNRTYEAVVHLNSGEIVQLADVHRPSVIVGSDGDADIGLAVTNMPYRQRVSWDSPGYNDVYVVDVETGAFRLILEELQGSAQLSPDAKFITWWDGHERAWFAIDVNGGQPVNLTSQIPHPVHDELADRPQIPNAYGYQGAGWTEDDELYLIYDKYDIWATDPTGRNAPRNITEGVGRRDQIEFRYVRLDPDQDQISETEPMLLRALDWTTKDGGFYSDRVRGDRAPEQLMMMDRSFGFPRKAKEADVLLLTRGSFLEFPDLWVTDPAFDNMRKVSDANPQQADYLWGTAELTHWNSTDGMPLTGILYKPENFDPSQQYPMMVYFYEKMSNTLHSHRVPSPGGSSINISFYVSRGYVVFVPDIHYRDGYPGESALKCVVPGVLSVLAQGFVDPDRVGVQGHSWGGYQIAYLVTQTDVFAAAEAGAPVVNMTSAYGGIRWGSGMSRMFQYERTQSRLGGSLWEVRPRYIENSPLFWADKIETPVLMLHNDEDTAVPWYQGIEFFVALRRLHKPVWLLNYNGEPHGLRKQQNRLDWTIRMQQFFDHYLKGAPEPVWMAEGVPAVLKGKDLGLGLVGEEKPITTGGGGR